MTAGPLRQEKPRKQIRRYSGLFIQYTLFGMAFGLCFPLIATLIAYRGRFSAITMGGIIQAHRTEPLLWIIDTVPFMLSLMSLFVGYRQVRTQRFAKQMKSLSTTQAANLVQVRTWLENIIDTMGEILVTTDKQGIITRVNVATVRLFGWEASELTGRSASILFGREKLEGILLSNPGDVFESGFINDLDGEYKTREGESRYLSISVTYIWDEYSNIEGVVCVGRDVTHQKEMEAALIESKENYERIFNSAPIPITIARKDRYLYFNPEAAQILDYSAEEMATFTYKDFIHPEDLQRVLKGQQIVEIGQASDRPATLRVITRHGEVRWLELRVTPLQWADGPAVLSFSIDTTERRKMEKALRDSEEKFRELVQSLNVIIMKGDEQIRFTFLNRFGQAFFGYSEEEVLGKSILGTITPPDDSSGRNLSETVQSMIDHPEDHLFSENENICRDGSRKWVSWLNKPVYSDQGELIEMMSIGYDITERRKSEAVIRKQQEKLEEAHNQTMLELEQARMAQLAALPGSLPDVPGVTLAVKYTPMSQIGGDFYDLFLDSRNRLCLLLGDVTGHGIPAALLSFMFLTTFKNSRGLQCDPDGIIAQCNRFLSGRLPIGKYATVYYCVYDPQQRVLHYSSAGHPPGFLLRKGADQPELLQTSGTVVGMFEEPVMPFQSRSVDLNSGDKVVIYTDGVMEVTDEEGNMLEPDTFARYVESRKELPIDQLLDDMQQYSSAISGPDGFMDDVTLVGMEID